MNKDRDDHIVAHSGGEILNDVLLTGAGVSCSIIRASFNASQFLRWVGSGTRERW
jgi:hypothetical protein